MTGSYKSIQVYKKMMLKKSEKWKPNQDELPMFLLFVFHSTRAHIRTAHESQCWQRYSALQKDKGFFFLRAVR